MAKQPNPNDPNNTQDPQQYDPNNVVPTNPQQVSFQNQQAQNVANNTVRINGQLPQSSPEQQHAQILQNAALQHAAVVNNANPNNMPIKLLSPDNSGQVQTLSSIQANQAQAQLSKQDVQNQVATNSAAQQGPSNQQVSNLANSLETNPISSQQLQQEQAASQQALSNTQGLIGADSQKQALLAAGGAFGLGLGPAIAAAVPTAGASLAALGGATAIAYAGGAISGQITAKSNALKENALQQTKMDYTNYKTSVTNLRTLIAQANKGDNSPSLQIAYKTELAKMDKAERDLQYISKVRPEQWSKNSDEIVRIANFNSGQRPFLDQAFAQALLKPDPNRVLDVAAIPDFGGASQ